MSKYTTEVRYICEHLAGYDDSKGCDDVDLVISKSWNKLFTTNCKFFDNDYRQILCSKILKHYYLREISSETVGIWKLWLNTKLEEIMPYYNQLYESALLEFNPFNDVDYTKEHAGESEDTHQGENSTVKGATGDFTSTENTSTAGTQNDISTSTDDRNIAEHGSYSGTAGKTDRYSDTPQGTISNTDLQGDSYLTNVRIINDTNGGSNDSTTADYNTSTATNDTASTSTGNTTISSGNTSTENVDGSDSYLNQNTNSYTERVFGKMSTTPYSELLNKFRDTFLNIDMMIINEFDELFLQLW